MKNLNKSLVFLVCFVLIFSFSLRSERIIRAGDRAEPTTLDPAEAWDSSTVIYLGNIFDRLVEIDPVTLKAKPSLAISWKPEKNGTVWKFRLRRGVKFHDGTPFNADSVVFTFKRQMDEIHKYGDFVLFKEIFSFLKDVIKTDRYEVKFILKEPFFPFPATLSVDCVSIVSPDAVKEKRGDFRYSPVGTGPYKMKNWIRNKKVVLESFKGYWKGRPGIDRYTTYVEPNVDKLIDIFRQQKIDILLSYSISKMVIFKGYDWVATSFSAELSTNFIAFNMKNKYLKRVGVRKALNYLWNKDILKLVYQNHVEPLCSLFPKGMPGYDCDNEKYPMSVNKARILLKKEGLQKGFPLSFIIDKDSALQLQVVRLFSRNLKKVGIRIKIIGENFEKIYDRISKGDYDLTFSGWIADYPDPFNIISSLFSKKLQEEGLANFSMEKNTDIIKLIEKTKIIKDPVKRKKYYLKLNDLVVERALLIPLYQGINVIIYNKKIGKLRKNHFGKIDLFALGKH